jgi:hypothetical protein
MDKKIANLAGSKGVASSPYQVRGRLFARFYVNKTAGGRSKKDGFSAFTLI